MRRSEWPSNGEGLPSRPRRDRGYADLPLYGTIAGLYDTALSLFGFSRGIRRVLDRLDVGETPPVRILDAGCGTGPLSFALLRRFPTREPLLLAPASFQLIVVGAALEHASLDRALPGLHRLLAPGGLLVNLGVRPSPAMRLLGRIYRFIPHDPPRLIQAATEAGFDDVRLSRLAPGDFPVNLTRQTLFARKR